MALQRFVGGYARLARLPAPRPAEVVLAPLASRVCGLMDGAPVRLEGDGELRVLADADQLEQVLINLLRNALEAGGGEQVVLRWRADGGNARIEVVDRGPGPPPGDNLFVPFFTTKPGGSGIGLVLSRQIVEAQRGTLVLEPGPDGRGAVATVVLPLPVGQ
ncbi:HAMP domain-containing histidine kinase [Lysobacter sp. GX 14042]|uniref:sensor histidine kinase n=1 Tax=Lysobacter sp. GX 14042 TaxID=2907155 RepID=UPI001F3B4622|nr:HAMP domain-containing histidine kinase [Lysobacter sp. GX 14042]